MTTAHAVKLDQDNPEASSSGFCQRLFDDIGAGSTWTSIQGAFAQMEIAEAAIDRVLRQYPDRKDDIDCCFVHLRWQLSVTVTDVVFRCHVDELLQRVVDNRTLALGTKAEALMALHAASLVAPPGARSAALFVELFAEIYGDALADIDGRIQEPWNGSSEELLSELRRKLKTDRNLSQ